MTNEQLRKIRAIVYDAYCEGDTEAEALLPVLDRAIAAPEQEPVVWMQSDHLNKFARQDCGADSMMARCSHRQLMPDYQPLYTAPPSREWQELSPLEMRDTLRNCAASTLDKLAPNWYEVRQFARAIESALRAKNSGEQA